MIYVLGIHDGHNGTAALLRDGQIVGAISEERLTRRKNEVGYPKRAIESVLRTENIIGKDLAKVVLSSNFMHSEDRLRNIDIWYRVGVVDQKRDEEKSYQKELLLHRLNERKTVVKNHLKIKKDKIEVVEHHLSHAVAAYYGSPFCFDDKVLILTCDGAGDGLSATVSIGHKGRIERIAETSRHDSLGKIYSRITYLMGMTPWEHEYKVMGMAPYAEEKRIKRSLEVFESLLGLDKWGLSFKRKTDLSMNYTYFYLKDNLENQRFDYIAGAVQRFTEDLLLQWVKNCIQKTGIHKVACGGGVFMNVKANMKIRQMPEVMELFVFPSCADESNSIGAAYQIYYDHYAKEKSFGIGDLFLGEGFDNEEIEKSILAKGCEIRWVKDIWEHVGHEIACGKIVALFQGRAEWGARALGNRSIVASAENRDNIERINKAIKSRDFWMPFAPTILHERAGKYLEDWRGEDAKYMIMAYHSTTAARKDLPAAMHPYDKTLRPQLVSETDHPDYYRLLKAFEKKTSIGGILNTSFNLHGYPIVNNPTDALKVFMNTGLENMAIGNYYISKRS